MANPVNKIERTTLTGTVTRVLRDRLLRGDFADGEQLRQEALSRELGVSRVPVREALRKLEAEGLVDIHDHRGAIVSRLSLQDVRECLEIRALLETDLLRHAIPRLQTKDIEKANAVLEAFDQSLDDEDVQRWGELNAQFHLSLYQSAGRPNTLALLDGLHHKTDRYIRMQISLAGYKERSHAEHRFLLALCADRKIEQATDYLFEHISNAADALETYFHEHPVTVGEAD